MTTGSKRRNADKRGHSTMKRQYSVMMAPPMASPCPVCPGFPLTADVFAYMLAEFLLPVERVPLPRVCKAFGALFAHSEHKDKLAPNLSAFDYLMAAAQHDARALEVEDILPFTHTESKNQLVSFNATRVVGALAHHNRRDTVTTCFKQQGYFDAETHFGSVNYITAAGAGAVRNGNVAWLRELIEAAGDYQLELDGHYDIVASALVSCNADVFELLLTRTRLLKRYTWQETDFQRIIDSGCRRVWACVVEAIGKHRYNEWQSAFNATLATTSPHRTVFYNVLVAGRSKDDIDDALFSYAEYLDAKLASIMLQTE